MELDGLDEIVEFGRIRQFISQGVGMVLIEPSDPLKLYDIENIVQLDNNTYAVKKWKEDKVMRIKIKFLHPEGYEEKVGLQEYQGTILKVNGQRGRIYSLVQEGSHIHLKIFKSSINEFVYSGSVMNIENDYEKFIIAFQESKDMQSKCLIADGEMFTRIYA